MSEKTLKEVGKQAGEHYAHHKRWSGQITEHEATIERIQHGDIPYVPGATTAGEAVQRIHTATDRARQAYDRHVQASAEFAKDNAEQLHDLAIIEAHLGGVAINVEQPLEIGQKIEVHKG